MMMPSMPVVGIGPEIATASSVSVRAGAEPALVPAAMVLCRAAAMPSRRVALGVTMATSGMVATRASVVADAIHRSRLPDVVSGHGDADGR